MRNDDVVRLQKLFCRHENPGMKVTLIEQGWGELQFNRDLYGKQGVSLGGMVFEFGFSTHADSRIRISSEIAMKKINVIAGAGENSFSKANSNQVPAMIFSLEISGEKIAQSDLLQYGESFEFDVMLPQDTKSIDLVVKAPESTHLAHAAWGNPQITFVDDITDSPCFYPDDLLAEKFPVSFQYGEWDSENFFQRNPLNHTVKQDGEDQLHTFVSEGDGLRMTVEWKVFDNFPVWEWHTRFENISQHSIPRLSRVKIINLQYVHAFPHRLQLQRLHGSFHTAKPDASFADWFTQSYTPHGDDLTENNHIVFGGVGGRPSDRWLPAWTLSDHQTVLRFAVGWSGQWCAEVSLHDKQFSIQAGLEDFDAELLPGETVTMPTAFFQFNEKGGEERSINIWRRFVTSKIMIPFDGTPPRLPLSLSVWGGLSEAESMERIADIERHKVPYDVYWIDAGWYAPPCRDTMSPGWTNYVGDWEFYPEQYPNELKRISSAIHRDGKKLLLWFEPERVISDRKLAMQHPEWLIFNESREALLNLGCPEAWQWCWNTISSIIERNGIDWYREDFNFEPLEYWRSKDTPNRKGITEIRFVEGLYRFWRKLRETFPHLMIDNCASGGRRLDLELLRYSVPLWYSDMQCSPDFDPEFVLVQNSGLAQYWPRFGGGGIKCTENDTYKFRACMNSGLTVAYFSTSPEVIDPEQSRDWLKERIAEYRAIQPCFGGDFYCLNTTTPHSNGMWSVLQYHLPEERRGVILAFRSKESVVEKAQLKPRGIEPDKVYSIYDTAGDMKPMRISGAELLRDGIEFALKTPYSSAIICYNEL